MSQISSECSSTLAQTSNTNVSSQASPLPSSPISPSSTPKPYTQICLESLEHGKTEGIYIDLAQFYANEIDFKRLQEALNKQQCLNTITLGLSLNNKALDLACLGKVLASLPQNKNYTLFFQPSSFEKNSEHHQISREVLKSYLEKICVYKNIIGLAFLHPLNLDWNIDEKSVSELKEILIKNSQINYWFFWDVTSSKLIEASKDWSEAQQINFARNQLCLHGRNVYESTKKLLPFTLPSENYFKLFEEFYDRYPDERHFVNLWLEKFDLGLEAKALEELQTHFFIKNLKNMIAAGGDLILDLTSNFFENIDVKILQEALNAIQKDNVRVQLTLNLVEAQSKTCMSRMVTIISNLPKQFKFNLILNSKMRETKQDFKTTLAFNLLKEVSQYQNINQIQLNCCTLWNMDLKRVQEFIEIIQKAPHLNHLNLWESSNLFDSETASWDETRKLEFARAYLQVEGNNNFVSDFSNRFLPYTLSYEQYLQIFSEFYHDFPKQRFKISHFTKTTLGLSPTLFKQLRSELGFFELRESESPVQQVSLQNFLWSKRNYEKLIVLLGQRSETTTIELFLSDLEKEEFSNLCDFVNLLQKRNDYHLIIHSDKIEPKGNAETTKLHLFIEKLNNTNVRSIYFDCDFGQWEFENFYQIMKQTVEKQFIKVIMLFSNHLSMHPPEKIARVMALFESEETLEKIYLTPNGFEKWGLKLLREIVDTLVNNRTLHKFILLSECEFASESLKTYNEADIEQLKDLFLSVGWVQESGTYTAQIHKPLLSILNPKQAMSFLQSFLNRYPDSEYVDYIQYSVQHLNLDYSDRFELAKNCVRISTEKFKSAPFKLDAPHCLELYLLGYEIDSDGCDLDDHDFYKANTSLASYELLEMGNDVGNNMDHSDAEGSLKKALIEKLIPKMRELLQKSWPNTNFFKPCLERFERILKSQGSEINLDKIMDIWNFFEATFCSLNIRKIENYKLLTQLLKEIVDYADPAARFHIIFALINQVLNTKIGSDIYAELTHQREADLTVEKRKKSKTVSILIPTVFLTKIILEGIKQDVSNDDTKQALDNSEGENKENKDNKEWKNKELEKLVKSAKEILKALPSQYSDGMFLRPFVSALREIAKEESLTPKNKLDFIKFILAKDKKYDLLVLHLTNFSTACMIADQKARVEKLRVIAKSVEGLCNNKEEYNSFGLNRYFDFQLPSAMSKMPKPQTKELGSETQLRSAEPTKQEARTLKRQLKMMEALTKIESNTLRRRLIDQILNALWSEKILKDQRRQWYLIQGLGLLGELKSLAGLKTAEFNAAAIKIFKNIFNLEEEDLKYFSEGFNRATGVNYLNSVFCYYSKLLQLGGIEKENLVACYHQFIKNILSPNQNEFYRQRYSLENHPHLKEVARVSNPGFLTQWASNAFLDLNEFVGKNRIEPKLQEINFYTFLKKKFENHHLDLKKYEHIKSYFQADSVVERQKIKEMLVGKLKLSQEPKDSKETDELDKHTKILFQSLILDLAETPPRDISAQVKLVRDGMKHLSKIDHAAELLNDLISVYRFLINFKTGKKRPQDKKGWQIGFTDDYLLLLHSGTDVSGSCQRVDGDPSLNKCLLNTICHPKIKMIAIIDATYVIQARALIRILLDKQTKQPVLFLEEIYPSFVNPDLKEAIVKFAIFLAEDFGLTLVTRDSSDDFYEYPNSLESLESVGPEYVDALHSVQQTGEYIIPTAQVLYHPHAELRQFLNKILSSAATDGLQNCISDTVLDYFTDVRDERCSNDTFGKAPSKTLHFSYRRKPLEQVAQPESAVAQLGLTVSKM